MPNISYSLLFAVKAFEVFPDAIVVVNNKGVIEKVNDKVFNIFGYKDTELVGKTIDILIPQKHRAGHGQNIANYFNNAEPRKMGSGLLLSALHKSGLEIFVDISLNPVETLKGVFVLAIIRDVSEKVHLQDSINSINEIKKELESFTYTLTHDLRAPLNKVQSITNLINLELEDATENSDVKMLFGSLSENLMRLDNLIQGVLSYSQSRIVRSESAEEVVLSEIVDEVIKMIEIPKRFEIHKDDNLPTIYANKTAIIQLFLNLFSNAISHNNKEKAAIRISNIEKEDCFEIAVADNGKTIPEHIKEKLFDIKTQMKNTADKASHGFGLSIIKEIVMANKSQKLWVEDNAEGGTTFKFTWMKSNYQLGLSDNGSLI